jgi:putative membrane protein
MKKRLCFLFSGALLILLTSCGGSSDSTSVDAAGKHNEELLETTGKDEKAGWFVAEVTSGGLMEAELGRLASSKGASPLIRELGQTLLNHHTQANTQLKQIADLKNLVLPTQMGDDHQDEYNEIMSKNGAAFDMAYLEAVMKEHKQAIKDFEEMATEGTDVELKAFANKSLPMLRAHLAQAEQLEDQLNP